VQPACPLRETEKPCGLAMYVTKRGQREGQWAVAERLLNIMPNYGDKTGSAEQCQKVAVVL